MGIIHVSEGSKVIGIHVENKICLPNKTRNTYLFIDNKEQIWLPSVQYIWILLLSSKHEK